MNCNSCGMMMVPMGNSYYCPYCGETVNPNNNSKMQTSKLNMTPSFSYDSPTYPTTERRPMITSPTFPIEEDSPSMKMAGDALYSKVVNGVAEIYFDCGSGSAFLVHNSGFMITCSHCVTDGRRIYNNMIAKICGEKIPATVVAVGWSTREVEYQDIAVLKLQRVPRSARVLNFADSNKLRTGQTIYIVGNANGEGTCISMGILSDKLRPRRNDGKPHLLVDCAAFHGNSGGPVFDEDANVIGVLDSGFDKNDLDNGTNYAVPSNYAYKLLNMCLSRKDSPYIIENRGAKGWSQIKPATCPECGSNNATNQNHIIHCPDCGKERGE